MTALNLGFLASHGGTSMRAIVGAIADGALDAQALIVISNNCDAPALQFARQHGIAVRHISATTAGSDAAADMAIAQALEDAGVDWVVMSGYLRKLGPATLTRYRGRILNIHPALLPKFGGKGMFGHHVHEAVLAAGERLTGATVHLVDAEYDHGPVLAQASVPVLAGDTADDLQYRVMSIEPELYVRTLRDIAAGTIPLPPP
jgi:phosphoribosylglycinamide formyltransferase-1